LVLFHSASSAPSRLGGDRAATASSCKAVGISQSPDCPRAADTTLLAAR
jgi:hypothetical protein